jgi:hypothetical protein
MLLAILIVLPALNNSDVKRMALESARSNPIILQRLGGPIAAGWFIKGSMEVNSSGGSAELEIPISGTKGDGTLYAYAQKSGDGWHMVTLQFAAKGDARREDMVILTR